MSCRPTVGDKVRVVCGNHPGYTPGFGHVVTDMSHDRLLLKLNGDDWWIGMHEVELIEEKEPKMTKLEEARKQYEALGATIAAMEAEEKAKRPELKPGQVWKHKNSTVYIVGCVDLKLTCIASNKHGWCCGSIWSENGFGSTPADFTYLGMASEVLTVTEKAK